MNALAQDLLIVAKEYLGPAAPVFLARELKALGLSPNTVEPAHVLQLAERARVSAGRLMDAERAAEFARKIEQRVGAKPVGAFSSNGHMLASDAAGKLLESGRYRQAEVAYRELIQRHSDVNSHRGLARALILLGDNDGALANLRDGAAAYARAGDRASAVALLADAVEIAPSDLASHRRFAAALANQGDLIGACEEYARFIDVALGEGDTRRAWMELAYGREALGDLPQLRTIVDRVAAAQSGVPTPPRAAQPAPAPRTTTPVPVTPAPRTTTPVPITPVPRMTTPPPLTATRTVMPPLVTTGRTPLPEPPALIESSLPPAMRAELREKAAARLAASEASAARSKTQEPPALKPATGEPPALVPAKQEPPALRPATPEPSVALRPTRAAIAVQQLKAAAQKAGPASHPREAPAQAEAKAKATGAEAKPRTAEPNPRAAELEAAVDPTFAAAVEARTRPGASAAVVLKNALTITHAENADPNRPVNLLERTGLDNKTKAAPRTYELKVHRAPPRPPVDLEAELARLAPNGGTPAEVAAIADLRATLLIAHHDPRAIEATLDAARKLLALHKLQAASDVLLDFIGAGFQDREAQRLLIEVDCELGRRDVAKEKCQLLGAAYRLDGKEAVADDVERLARIL